VGIARLQPSLKRRRTEESPINLIDIHKCPCDLLLTVNYISLKVGPDSIKIWDPKVFHLQHICVIRGWSILKRVYIKIPTSIGQNELVAILKKKNSRHAANSGAPAARRAAKRSPILISERKGNPWVNFLMVIMASGIVRGRVRTTATATTTESRNMAAILQIIGWQNMHPCFTVNFFDIRHPYYDQLTSVKTRYPLTSIMWPYRGLKFTAHGGHAFFEVDRWSSAAFRLDCGLTPG